MAGSGRWIVLGLLSGAIGFAPIAVGAVDAAASVPVAIAVFAFVVYAFRPAQDRLGKRLALVVLSVCVAVTLFDLAARPLFFSLFDVRPSDRFIVRWPPLPLLQRYVAGVKFDGVTYGDLSAVSGRKDWRENRRIRFVIDEYGFRNEPGADAGSRPLDVIVLGDSFGVAAGTSQEEILSSVLARDYGLSVYNLSISRENPQQEYVNLRLEGKRLKVRSGTCVLWLIFPGNDLDEPYYPELDNPSPAWPGVSTRVVNGFRDFRLRSPVRRLLSRSSTPAAIVERTFLDGRPLLFLPSYVERRRRTADDVVRHTNFESLKKTLGAMEKLAAERSLTVAVALVPSKEEVYSWVLDGGPPWSGEPRASGFSVVLRGLCEQHGFRFLDLTPGLADASRRAFETAGALLWWHDDTHWNGEGQRFAAAAIHEHLLSGVHRR